jgi:hypothetical protein
VCAVTCVTGNTHKEKMSGSGVSINGSISYDERDLSDESENHQGINTNTANTFIENHFTYSGPIYNTNPITKPGQTQPMMSNLSISPSPL